MYWIIFGVFTLVSLLVQRSLQSKFKRFSQIRLPNGMTGADVAQKMLVENGINDVTVGMTHGTLTDYYNPVNKSVNLSDPVYGTCSVAAAAVAAHECGHAVQHAKGYVWLKLRSAMVPAVSISSRVMMWVFLAGMLLLQFINNPILLYIGIVLYAVTTLFSVITLPVEINASKRALAWLKTACITDATTQPQAESALKAAAYTYVVAALGSLATLFYYIGALRR